MKQVTRQMLLDAAPVTDRTRVDVFCTYLNQWAAAFGVDTDLRLAHFLGQVFHESACLRHVEEDLRYSAKGLLRVFPKYFKTEAEAKAYEYRPAKIANRVYANRMGNGTEQSGDGYKYRGRGLIQLTGKQNYAAYQKSGKCNGDILTRPQLIAQFPGAMKSALWYWQKNGLSALADRDDVTAITRKINGGTNGLSEREYLTTRFKQVLGVV